ncbi:MAG: DUF975 family protein [Clostridiales bacterium]|nr:DUF975 family protein [Clostridiales bacterium]
MWTRKEVKTKGKASFKANFWKCVATGLIIAVIGGTAGSTGAMGAFKHPSTDEAGYGSYSFIKETSDEDGLIIEGDDETIEINTDDENGTIIITENEDGERTVEVEDSGEISGAAIIAAAIIVSLVMIVAVAIGIAFDVLIVNPLELGCRRFFRKNLDEPASMSNIAFGFDSNYKGNVKTMFFRDLYVTLWSLLFIIPGIVKYYEYKMIPYLLSEDPTMTTEQAFAESKRLMTGNKWKAFVLDLSFILWDILSLMTCGIVGIFYVNPYKASTDAALYETLKYGTAVAKA